MGLTAELPDQYSGWPRSVRFRRAKVLQVRQHSIGARPEPAKADMPGAEPAGGTGAPVPAKDQGVRMRTPRAIWACSDNPGSTLALHARSLGSNPNESTNNILRRGAVAARLAHTQKDVGANPTVRNQSVGVA